MSLLNLIICCLFAITKIIRAAAGIEPATSRTRNENHTTRPSALELQSYPAFSLKRAPSLSGENNKENLD